MDLVIERSFGNVIWLGDICRLSDVPWGKAIEFFQLLHELCILVEIFTEVIFSDASARARYCG